MQALPKYIEKINNNNTTQKYLKNVWEVEGEFEHDLASQYMQKGESAIKNTPYGNTILKDFGKNNLIKIQSTQETDTLLSRSYSFSNILKNLSLILKKKKTRLIIVIWR